MRVSTSQSLVVVCAMAALMSATAVAAISWDVYGYGAGVTGGNAGTHYTVTSCAELVTAAKLSAPAYIVVNADLADCGEVKVTNDKTFIGADKGKKLMNTQLTIQKVSNVIVRNLVMGLCTNDKDPVHIQFGSKVWVDHNEFYSDQAHGKDYYDGLVDITHASALVTVSNNFFHDHYKCSLVGHSDTNGKQDTGKLTVTYYNNFFNNTNSRNPSVRFGSVHVAGNYYLNNGDYGVASRMGAQVCVEANYFENVGIPVAADQSLSKQAGYVNVVNTNTYVSSGANSILSGFANTWKPSYSLPATATYTGETLKNYVLANAGVGKMGAVTASNVALETDDTSADDDTNQHDDADPVWIAPKN